MARSLILAGVLACACGPTVDEPCLDVSWSLVVDDVSGVQVCDFEIAPDGTIVLFASAPTGLVFVEIEPGGDAWRVVELPAPGRAFHRAQCGDLVISSHGDRWGTAAFEHQPTQAAFYVLRAPADGEPSLTPVVGEMDQRGPLPLAVDGEVVHAAGASVAEPYDLESQWVGLLGVIDPRTSAWIVEHRYPGLPGVRTLVPASGRLHALMAEPSIDWGSGHVLAIDPTSGDVAWQRFAGVIGHDFDPQLIGLHASDIALARTSGRTTQVERIDASGRTLWEHAREYEIEWGSIVEHAIAATPREIVSIVDIIDRSSDTFTTRAEVLDLDGNQVCTTALEVPFADRSYRLAKATSEQIITTSWAPMNPTDLSVTAISTPTRQ